MRMWGVEPKVLCRQHLLGEHLEMHMFATTIRRGISIDGYVKNGLVQPELVYQRHQDLVVEMIRREMNHKSPMEPFNCAPRGYVDIQKNLDVLVERCGNCKRKQGRGD